MVTGTMGETDTVAREIEDLRRLTKAYEAALLIATEMNAEHVLQRIVDLAVEVVPAKYAALGVADETGKIVLFVTHGITPEERAAIGPIPQGHGLLGELIREKKPMIVHDISKDPRSVGFPPHHPPMKSVLGVPILLGDRVLGNLYLTEPLHQPRFTPDDLRALEILAAHAAATIDRSHLYREVQQARERAIEELNRTQAILDNLPSAVFIIDTHDNTVRRANITAIEMIFGSTEASGCLPQFGRDFTLLSVEGTPLHPSEQPHVRAARDEPAVGQQVILECADGRRTYMLAHAAKLPQATDEPEQVILVLQNINRLRESEQLKDDFLSLISHEFRTPLTSIQGGAHFLASQGEQLDPETRGELLSDIVAESERLNRMLSNMLSLTAILAGRLFAVTEPVAVRPVAATVAREVGSRSPSHRFVVDIPDDLPPAEGDVALLGQVLRNLYENAVKYSPNGGEVYTTARTENGRIIIDVADQGIGIAPEHVHRVFERFHRAGSDPTVRGMGLGLYLSRHLVEAQGGTIWASSPGVGKGSVFTVSLPQAAGWTRHEHD